MYYPDIHIEELKKTTEHVQGRRGPQPKIPTGMKGKVYPGLNYLSITP
jgi:hypothetical protein